MLSNLIFISFFVFTIYRSVIYYRQVTLHEKETGKDKKTYDDKFGSYMIDILYLGVYLSCLYAWYNYGLNTIPEIIGFIMVAYSWKIRLIAFKELDKNYGHEIKIFENHKLVTTGIYTKVRHPMYARLMLDVLGVAVMSQFYVTWIFALLQVVNVLRRIRIEDRILVERLGDEAIKYQKEVGALNIFQKL